MSDTAPPFVKISVLAAQSDVPAATIKHYLREGLIPEGSVRTRRNTATYDRRLVDRIKAIKELQRTRFLPLKVIKEILDEPAHESVDETARSIAATLQRLASSDRRTRAELIEQGVRAEELSYLESLKIVKAEDEGGTSVFGGDDLALLRTLGAARRAGLSAEMLPPQILEPYVAAIRELCRIELSLFQEGVLPRAGADVEALTEAATVLSERLIVLLRRKMLVPTLGELVSAQKRRAAAKAPSGPRDRAEPKRRESKTETRRPARRASRSRRSES